VRRSASLARRRRGDLAATTFDAFSIRRDIVDNGLFRFTRLSCNLEEGAIQPLLGTQTRERRHPRRNPMTMRSRLAGGLVSLFAFLGLTIMSGCGGEDDIGKRYSVSGKVTYKGEPVPKGIVTFTPEDSKSGRPAAATIQSDGSYTLTTLPTSPGDGALPGNYLVSIAASDVDISATQGKPGGMYRVDIITKAPRKDFVPRKYGNANKSGLKAEVKAETNRFDFDLQD
jgi:hypothetical protein